MISQQRRRRVDPRGTAYDGYPKRECPRWVDTTILIRWRADVRPDHRTSSCHKSSKDRSGDFMTAREILRYVGCTLGPVVPDAIFAGTKCLVMADRGCWFSPLNVRCGSRSRRLQLDGQECAGDLRPKAGDCCVFCSYRSVPCPRIQNTHPKCCQVPANALRVRELRRLEVLVSTSRSLIPTISAVRAAADQDA